ncbi:TPA: hypothetical protein ACQWMF_000742 [Neisseria subflava]
MVLTGVIFTGSRLSCIVLTGVIFTGIRFICIILIGITFVGIITNIIRCHRWTYRRTRFSIRASTCS